MNQNSAWFFFFWGGGGLQIRLVQLSWHHNEEKTHEKSELFQNIWKTLLGRHTSLLFIKILKIKNKVLLMWCGGTKMQKCEEINGGDNTVKVNKSLKISDIFWISHAVVKFPAS